MGFIIKEDIQLTVYAAYGGGKIKLIKENE